MQRGGAERGERARRRRPPTARGRVVEAEPARSPSPRAASKSSDQERRRRAAARAPFRSARNAGASASKPTSGSWKSAQRVGLDGARARRRRRRSPAGGSSSPRSVRVGLAAGDDRVGERLQRRRRRGRTARDGRVGARSALGDRQRARSTIAPAPSVAARSQQLPPRRAPSMDCEPNERRVCHAPVAMRRVAAWRSLALLTAARSGGRGGAGRRRAGTGTNPFVCTLQQAGTGTDFPDPDADPFCVEFDKTHQNVTSSASSTSSRRSPRAWPPRRRSASTSSPTTGAGRSCRTSVPERDLRVGRPLLLRQGARARAARTSRTSGSAARPATRRRCPASPRSGSRTSRRDAAACRRSATSQADPSCAQAEPERRRQRRGWASPARRSLPRAGRAHAARHRRRAARHARRKRARPPRAAGEGERALCPGASTAEAGSWLRCAGARSCCSPTPRRSTRTGYEWATRAATRSCASTPGEHRLAKACASRHRVHRRGSKAPSSTIGSAQARGAGSP